MATQTVTFPPLPDIGRPESFYAHRIHQADRAGDHFSHEAHKVAQYITLALDPNLEWEEKLKYFTHALNRHCQPPPFPDEQVWMFYKRLANWVRENAGSEALRLASLEDDLYAARLNMGQDREKIEDDAEIFFARLLGTGDRPPEHFNEEDWQQLKLMRDQWI